jgi:RimJ/RimL family protein N-acetyltransferase
MSVALHIRRLRVEDADALIALRREALENVPLAFASSLEDDRLLSIEFARTILTDDHEQAVFGRFEGVDLTGMVGLFRASKVKYHHKGELWGMYVAPRARNKGVGRALLEAAIQLAHEWGLDQVQLGVTDDAPVAKRLYESAGFRLWGREPRSLRWKGRFVDEHHFALDLSVNLRTPTD